MSQSVLNWSESLNVLEPLIRQIVQEELAKLAMAPTQVDKLAKKRILPKTFSPTLKRSEQLLIGLWKDREEMQDVENYVRQLRKPRY
jgi:hypothetical protein